MTTCDGPLTLNDGVRSETHETEHDSLLAQEPQRLVICVVTPMFMGYAALVSFQADIKQRLGIMDSGSRESYLFGEAVSLLFLGALIFRLMHNILLSWLTPRQRVVLACCTMTAALTAVAVVFYALGIACMPLVYVVYICGGIAVGTFEANLVSAITPLGHATKKFALLGMPLGYNGVSIGGFGLFALAPSSAALQGSVFAAVGVLCLIAAALFLWVVPHVGFEASGTQSATFLHDCLLKWRQWVPKLLPNIVALFVDMFACILASTVALYVFKVDAVPWFPGVERGALPYNVFQALFNFFGFVGDFSARRVAYQPPQWWPVWASSTSGNPTRFLVLTVAGLALCLAKVGLLAPIGMLLIMFGNGMIYATTTKYIDVHVGWEFNLVALSMWLFTGDCGSFVASSLTTAASNAIGRCRA